MNFYLFRYDMDRYGVVFRASPRQVSLFLYNGLNGVSFVTKFTIFRLTLSLSPEQLLTKWLPPSDEFTIKCLRPSKIFFVKLY